MRGLFLLNIKEGILAICIWFDSKCNFYGNKKVLNKYENYYNLIITYC